MKATLEVIATLQREKLVLDFAIGGAVAAFRYLEPSLTDDLDIYVHVRQTGPILDLSPIFQWLAVAGYREFKHEGLLIEGWPVQFLPPGSALEEEALRQAVVDELEGVPFRVLTAEHLMAIALQLGRSKDRVRLAQFVEARCYDEPTLLAILARHGLTEKWRRLRALLDDHGS